MLVFWSSINSRHWNWYTLEIMVWNKPFLTDTHLWLTFVLFSGPIPQIDAQEFHIQITLPGVDGENKRAFDIALTDLKSKYSKHEVVAMLQVRISPLSAA
jgi:hypothetical protein